MTASCKLTIREIAEELNIAYGSAQDILVNDLGLRRVAVKLVPKDLNFMQKSDRVDVAKDMLYKVDFDPSFIKRIITGEETWIYEYDTHSRHEASEWRSSKEPRPKKPRRFQSKKKVMLTVFMDYRGVVHHEFLPEGHTVNKEYYLGVMRRLREAVRQKDRIFGQTTRGFCTTITHRRTIPSLSASIWLKMKRIPSKNHRIHLIWLPATFFYSVDSRNRFKERVTAPKIYRVSRYSRYIYIFLNSKKKME